MIDPATLFGRSRAVIGMIHLDALPGTPYYEGEGMAGVNRIVDRAAAEAQILERTGFDGAIIENMHDRPYVQPPHGPESVAVITRAALAVRSAAPKLKLGIQVLSCGTREAISIALTAGAGFIRAENFVFAHVADEGLLASADAGPLLRYRRAIGAEHVAVLCDIKKKHAAHALTADVPITHMAESAELFGADGVIVTGTATGKPTSTDELEAVRRATELPVLVGSGANPAMLLALFLHADAVIVGSWIKREGVWNNPVDPGRCGEFIKAAELARR